MSIPKTAFITGAARGIGKAAAVRLAQDGYSVVVADRCQADEAQSTLSAIAQHGQAGLFVRCDVGRREEIEGAFAEALARFGRLETVVSNVAYQVRKPLLELLPEEVEQVWRITAMATFHCAQLAARQMVAQGQGGNIIVISSIHADRAYKNSTAYNGAKAAVNQMAKTWALELAPHRIRVNIVEPGWTDTPGERQYFTEEQLQEQSSHLPFGRLAKPEEIAEAVAFLANPANQYVTGSVLRVDGGMTLPYTR